MLVQIGECLGVTTRRAGSKSDPSKQWDERVVTLVVGRDGTSTTYVTLAQNFEGDLPGRGEIVALRISQQSRIYKERIYTDAVAWGRVPEVEAALSAALV